MRNTAIFIIGLALFVSCQKKKEEQDTAIEEIITDHPTKEIKAPEEQCYLKVRGKDSIKVNFSISGDSIEGIYHNLPYQIDKRISTFKGVLKNDSGVAISRYSAEGSDYVEELRFTIKGNNLHLDYGPVEEDKDGIWRYKNGSSSSQHILPKVDCGIYSK